MAIMLFTKCCVLFIFFTNYYEYFLILLKIVQNHHANGDLVFYHVPIEKWYRLVVSHIGFGFRQNSVQVLTSPVGAACPWASRLTSQ